jgi:ABC-type glutathione transport system ATPase component
VLLEGRQLSKVFAIEGGVLRRRMGSVQALKDVSFQVQKGETLAVVGGSGCGKTTLAKIIAGLLSPDAGELLWEGQSLGNLGRLERAHRIQLVFQDPFASLNPKLSVGTQLREVCEEDRIGPLLESVGLPADAVHHYPFQFSGGQRQRIAIARALAMQPALLVADEPLSALDVTVQAQMLDLFRNLKSRYALTLLFITHDLAVVQDFADRVLVLQNGQVVEVGPARELLSQPKTAYAQALLEAVPKIP